MSSMPIIDGMTVPRFAPYHWIDAARFLYEGGFRYGHGIVTMLAISEVESNRGMYRLGPLSSFNPPRLRLNEDGTYDRGWLMVNTIHKTLTDADMADPVKCAAACFKLSSKGENFRPWTQWRTGAYRPHMDVARFAVALLYLELGIKSPAPLKIARP